jgi:hypothetical protein
MTEIIAAGAGRGARNRPPASHMSDLKALSTAVQGKRPSGYGVPAMAYSPARSDRGAVPLDDDFKEF